MDVNELANQLSSNPQLCAQFMQMMQQQNGNGQMNQANQRAQNWNMPTNPMAALAFGNLWNNFVSSMNGGANNQNNMQTPQKQNNTNTTQQSPNAQTQQTKNRISSVRIIKSPDDIKADEIPMDDSISLFLQDDLSVIYGKRWTNNGVVENLSFILEDRTNRDLEDSKPNNPMFDLDDFMKKVSDLMDDKLNQLKKEYYFNKRGSGKPNKGVEENGA